MGEVTKIETPSAAKGTGSRLRFHAGEMAAGLARAAQSGSRLLAEAVTLSPLAVLIALAALGAWWHEHNQHLRQAGELQQLKKQTAADVAQLQSQAARAAEEANQERAGRIVALELQRQKSQRDAQALSQRLADLQSEQQRQAAQVAALPPARVASELASRLELAPQDLAPGGLTTGATAAPDEGAGAASLATPAAPENAPSRQAAGSNPSPATPGTGRSSASAPETGQARPPAPPGTDYFRVSDAALRKIDAALVALDGCTKQAQVKDGFLADCHGQAQASAAIIDEQKASLAKLNEALADKDQILTKRETEHQAELKAVRGTLTSRVLRTLEHVGIGVAIGLVVRR